MGDAGTYKKPFMMPSSRISLPTQGWYFPYDVGICVRLYCLWWRRPSANWKSMKKTMKKPRIW